jgi:hypothetical protein
MDGARDRARADGNFWLLNELDVFLGVDVFPSRLVTVTLYL